MTLLVPDKAQARGTVLTSLIALLSALQLGGDNHNHHDLNDRSISRSRYTRSNNHDNHHITTTNNHINSNSNHSTNTPSHCAVAMYFAFLTKLARSNKTSHRAYR